MDDGHFQKVLDNELRALHNACKGKNLSEIQYDLNFFVIILALYMNNPLPKITFVVVKKRHNTRFFIRETNPNTNTVTMSNVQPGRIILF